MIIKKIESNRPIIAPMVDIMTNQNLWNDKSLTIWEAVCFRFSTVILAFNASDKEIAEDCIQNTPRKPAAVNTWRLSTAPPKITTECRISVPKSVSPGELSHKSLFVYFPFSRDNQIGTG